VAALQNELDRLDSPLRLTSRPSDVFSAGGRLGSRTASATCAANERRFHVELWNEGVQCLSGWCDELPEAARAIARWFKTPAPVRELAERFPFLEPNPLAEAYEAGTAVEFRWRQLLDEPPHDELRPLIEEASRCPELRRLFAYTSMFSLCFSRWVGYPFSGDLPRAAWTDGRFEVLDPSNRAIGSGDELAAADLLVGALPSKVDVVYRRPENA
jgi:hypothetical protein